jgi:adenine-specific DNA-methyltransferase
MHDISAARELRKNLTEAERLLWRHLRYRQMGGHKFRRQHPVGQYVVDFACLEKGLAIELDGGHHPEQADYDSTRSAWLEAQGFRVLRFWNNHVLKQVEAIKEVILEALSDPHPIPSP